MKTINLKRILFYTMLVLSTIVIVVACSNDDKVTPHIFDDNLLEERLSQPGIKYYENGKEVIITEMEMGTRRANNVFYDLDLNGYNNDSFCFSLEWTFNKSSISKPDTFEMKSFNIPDVNRQFDYGIVLVDSLRYKEDIDKKLNDSVFLSGAFNVEIGDRKIKGVFSYKGRIGDLLGE